MLLLFAYNRGLAAATKQQSGREDKR